MAGRYDKVCLLCRRPALLTARLGLCADCLRERYPEAEPLVQQAHARAREPFGLPASPPRTKGGLLCDRCQNLCVLGPGEMGYCGLRQNLGGRLTGGDADDGRLSWYLDPLPTNCVAAWVCAGGCGAGWPRFARRQGPEIGCSNLAVFYRACGFDCLFCQNWHYKQETHQGPAVSAAELAGAICAHTTCICYFGGDPGPQVVHSLAAARLARAARPDGILRICWETNGSLHPRYLKEMAALALESGGTIKLDLKAASPGIHRALCGARGKRARANFRLAARYFNQRREPPLLVASTLLVPGYVDEAEVSAIARFIAGVNPDIPYFLLAFYPSFLLDDLPTTSRRHASQALAAARAQGLRRVRLGNEHLLGREY